jgi:rhodanese-related sulfurtransferase
VNDARKIDATELQRLLDGARLVEVLPEPERADEHLPRAVNIPPERLDAASTVQLKRNRAVAVYRWDGL